MSNGARVFKSAWFAKAARKAKISDIELCRAIAQVMAGQADDLGGGVFKKRLSGNRYRSIVLARGGKWWVYVYLFAKQDRANIADDELMAFRLLAKSHSAVTPNEAEKLTAAKDWIEICAEMKIGNEENKHA